MRFWGVLAAAALAAWFFKVWNERDWKLVQARQTAAIERIAGTLERIEQGPH